MNFLTNIKESKDHIVNKKNIFFLIIVTIIFLIDRYSKNIIIEKFNDKTYFINDHINIDLIWNIGIGFGLFSTLSPIFYNIITFLIGSVIIILFYIFIISESTEKLIYSFIIGGALGNFFDRLTYQAVPDFIDIHYNNFHWFTFNVADIFISIGIISFIVSGFFVKNN